MLKPEANERLTIDEVLANDRVKPSVHKLLAMPEYKNEYIHAEKCFRASEHGKELTGSQPSGPEDEAWYN